MVGTDWWHILQAVLMSKTLPYNRCRGTFWQRFPQLWRMKRVYFQLLSITSSIWVCKTSLLWSKRGRAAKDVAFLQACVPFALQPFYINWSYRLLFVAMRIVIIDSRKIYPKVHSLSPLCALLYAGVHYLCEHNPNLPPCRAAIQAERQHTDWLLSVMFSSAVRQADRTTRIKEVSELIIVMDINFYGIPIV